MADNTSSPGKRAGEHTAAEQAQPKKQKFQKPILVVLPGAGGKLAIDVEAILRLGRCLTCASALARGTQGR